MSKVHAGTRTHVQGCSNEAIVRGLAAPAQSVDTPTFDLGHARVSLERALELAGELEDEALVS
ncbi:hypothetical protein ACFQ23_04385 [Schaalia naturae]|jgi:hypothetical protein|uniref:Uncharacterized protein n=1 Tax=Schaalia naturae TaxID=635203 RepID=A0ABW2SQG5_9ACTO